MAINAVATLGNRRPRKPPRSFRQPRTFLLAKTAQQVKSRTLIRESLAFAASAAGSITWGTLLILLAG